MRNRIAMEVVKLRAFARAEARASRTDLLNKVFLLNKLEVFLLRNLFGQDYKRTCYAGLHCRGLRALSRRPRGPARPGPGYFKLDGHLQFNTLIYSNLYCDILARI